MVGVIATVAAATILFTHNFPSVTVPGVPALVTANCGSSLASGTITTSSGVILFGCVLSNAIVGAFTTGTSGVAVVSSGGIPVGYTDLYATPCSGIGCPFQATCATTMGSVALLSMNPGPATPLTITVSAGTGLAANTQYAYCADYTNPSTSALVIPTFTVSWQQ